MMTTLSVVPEYVQGAPSYMYTDTTVPFAKKSIDIVLL